jgi:stress response protein YsnF
MAFDIDDPRRLKKAAVIGGDGKKLGTVSAVYYDNDTDQPEWIAVRTGLFGLDVSLVPLAAAQLRGEELHVPFDKERLKTAPHHDPGLELTPQDEMDLFSHYDLPYTAPSTSAAADTATAARRPEPPSTHTATAGGRGQTAAEGTGAGTNQHVSGPTAGDAMTRSEEQLRVRTESQAVERVRLRKHIVTEYQQVTVPVRREEIRLEHEPVGGPTAEGGAGLVAGAGAEVDSAAGGAIVDAVPGQVGAGQIGAGEEHEIVLHAERPVVRTETVPVERVRVGKQTVTEQQQVGGEVRKEEIELDKGHDTARDDLRR